jgi:hypothetical protein
MRNDPPHLLAAEFALDFANFLASAAIDFVRIAESLLIFFARHLAVPQGNLCGLLLGPTFVKSLFALHYKKGFVLGPFFKLVQFIPEMALIVAHVFASSQGSSKILTRGCGTFNLDILLAHLIAKRHQMWRPVGAGSLNVGFFGNGA